ncbi:hypothetical protein GPX89_34500 [Nocardia sp. ET3-3]|uniref:HEAT repeat domain-containing protein n=1 Tax=Nocardia terrae TaxID=2675851 RepID=A0A7K1V6S0_9NOCA|nr:hypothetical protein [Nocardia terrae]
MADPGGTSGEDGAMSQYDPQVHLVNKFLTGMPVREVHMRDVKASYDRWIQNEWNGDERAALANCMRTLSEASGSEWEALTTRQRQVLVWLFTLLHPPKQDMKSQADDLWAKIGPGRMRSLATQLLSFQDARKSNEPAPSTSPTADLPESSDVRVASGDGGRTARPHRGPYDPDTRLEKAGLLFLTRSSTLVVAVGLFAYLVDRVPNASPPWYGIGNGLSRLAYEQHSLPLFRYSVAALRRSLVEDPENRLARELLDTMRGWDALSDSEFAEVHAFEGSPLTLLPRLGFTAAALVDATMALPRDDRMRIILWLRPQGIEDFVPVLIAAVQDPDEHIRMTAIEYLGYWGDRSDVRECFERLVNSGEHRELQPYAGMALYSIEEDWARRLHQRMMHG